MKKYFSQKYALLIGVGSIVLGFVGMMVNLEFSSHIFLFGFGIILGLILWKLWLISQGKEKWGIY